MSRKKAVAKYVIPEMCNGCTAYSGERMQCPIQDEPGWLYKRYGVCWSKRTETLRSMNRFTLILKNTEER